MTIRQVPEPEVVDAVLALGDGEEGLAVVALHPADEQDPAVQLDRPGVEDPVDAEAFHQVRVRLGVQVVAPEGWGMGRGEDGVPVPVDGSPRPPVVDLVGAGDEILVRCL